MKSKKTPRTGAMIGIFVAGCTFAFAAHAVNKCTGPDGAIVYQDAPCSTANAKAKAAEVKLWTNSSSSGHESIEPNSKIEGPPQADALLNLYRRWVDAERLALSTSRIALAGPAANMQVLQREVEALKVPACLSASHATLKTLISKSVEAILQFMGKEEVTGMLYKIVDKRKLVPEFERSITKAQCQ